MRNLVVSLFALALVCCCFAPAVHAQAEWYWQYQGKVQVDGQHDHDVIQVSETGIYSLQIRAANAPIQLDRIVVRYRDAEPQTLHVRDVIRAGGKSPAIGELRNDRFIQTVELWYAKSHPKSGKPEVTLYARRRIQHPLR